MARKLNDMASRKVPQMWVHVAAVIAVTAWGLSFINTKVLLDNDFTPVQVYVFRCIIAYFLLLAFSFRIIKSHSWRHELLFLLCGISGGSIYFVAENAALLYTTATNVSLITSLSPLISALLVFLLYKDERPSRGFFLGSLVAMVGVTMVILGGVDSHSAGAEHNFFGDILSFLAAICWSVYAILLRNLQAFYSPIVVTRKTFFYGLITAVPFLLLEPSRISVQTFARPQVWLNLLILAVFASSLAFLIWAWVIRRIGAVKAGNYIYFQPIFTLIFGYIILHQHTSAISFIGCIVTLAGIYASERLSKEKRRLHH
ncbi:MAG: DMT family transporter [Muribaculaceae bacterium]|nr:DMT family transporter [Muribaculaceae bacterium]